MSNQKNKGSRSGKSEMPRDLKSGAPNPIVDEKGTKGGKRDGDRRDNFNPRAPWSNKAYSDFRNHDEWYGTDDKLMQYAQNIIFGEILGKTLDLNAEPWSHNWTSTGSYFDYGLADNQLVMPGVMTLPIVCNPGISDSTYSAITQCAELIRAKIQREINKNPTYDRTDLMIVLQCLDSILYMYQYGLRAYQTANTYSTTNRYLWKVTLAAQGFDPDDVHAHMGDFKYNLLQLALRIENLFFIPYELPLFKRHQYMFKGIFSDGTAVKSQLYQFVPAGWYRWNEVDSEQGSLAEFRVHPHLDPYSSWTTGSQDLMKVNEYYEIMRDLIEQAANSTDFSNMMGDLAKAYGGISLGVEKPDDGSVVTIDCQEEMLNQIQNATIMPYINGNASFDPTTFNITQDVNRNCLIFRPLFPAANAGSGYNAGLMASRVLSTLDNDPSVEKVVKLSRLVTECIFPGKDNGSGTIVADMANIMPTTCGTEIVCGAFMFVFTYSSDEETHAYGDYKVVVVPRMDLGLSSAAGNNIPEIVSTLEKFDWHPMVTSVTSVVPDTYGGLLVHGFKMYWDIQNYAVVKRSQLVKVNDQVILGEYGLRSVGKV